MVIYNDLVHLRSLGHEVHLLAITNNPNARADDASRICPARYFYRCKPPRWWQVITNAGHRLPFGVSRYVDRRLRDAAAELIRQEKIEVVLIDDEVMGPYGPMLRDQYNVPFFVRGHNVAIQIIDRFVSNQRNPILRLLGKWQSRKVLAYEHDLLESADGFSMITESDAAEVRRRFGGLDGEVVGAGTDLDYFRPSEQPRTEGLIVHLGSLTAFTKLEAMLWFCRKVLPRIRACKSNARLQLVGFVPPGRFEEFEGVEVVGKVDDERPYLARGQVFIAPQFVGSGVRVKILNAMATCNAVVCTPIACEGIPLIDGQHALVREDAEGFAEAVVSLLEDSNLARLLGQNARVMAEEKYNWDAVVKELERHLLRIAANPADSE